MKEQPSLPHNLYRLLKGIALLYLVASVILQYKTAIFTRWQGIFPVLLEPYNSTTYAVTFDSSALWLGLVVAILYEVTDLLYVGFALQILSTVSEGAVYISFSNSASSFSSVELKSSLALVVILLAMLCVRRFIFTCQADAKPSRAVNPYYRYGIKGLAIVLWVVLTLQLAQYIWCAGFLWFLGAWYFCIAPTLFVALLGYIAFRLPERPYPAIIYLTVMLPMLVVGSLLGTGVIAGPTTFLSKVEGLIFGLLAILAVYHWIRDFIL